MVTEFFNHPKSNGAIRRQLCPLEELAWQGLLFYPRATSRFRLILNFVPVEKYQYEDSVFLNEAIELRERHPSNSATVGGVAEMKKTVQDSVHAFLVTATLLAGLTFGAYLQPPFGTYVGDYKIKAAKFFWIFISLSFYFAVYTILRVYHPK